MKKRKDDEMKAHTGTERVGRRKKGGKELNVFQQMKIFFWFSFLSRDPHLTVWKVGFKY